jgi:hypothetical protein
MQMDLSRNTEEEEESERAESNRPNRESEWVAKYRHCGTGHTSTLNAYVMWGRKFFTLETDVLFVSFCSGPLSPDYRYEKKQKENIDINLKNTPAEPVIERARRLPVSVMHQIRAY